MAKSPLMQDNNHFIDNKNNSSPTTAISWDVIIPSSLFAASAICYIDPTMAPSIIFALLAFATLFISPVMQYFTKPATQSLTYTLTDALNTITDEGHSEQREKLFFAIADLISKSLQSTALTSALKESLVSSLMDEDVRSTAQNVVKQSFVGALNDEDFVHDFMTSIVGAIVQASKEEELTQSVLDVVTRAVSQALADESFVKEIRGAVKDTLQDGDIYKAGAKGIVSAGLGFFGSSSKGTDPGASRTSSTHKFYSKDDEMPQM